MIPHRVRLASVALIGVSSVVSKASAATYYVDYSAGSDSKDGGSKQNAWKHAPGMNGCTANCSSTTIQGGDSVLLKGGVAWPNAALPWVFNVGGTKGHNVYFGVDTTWFNGGGWTRPVLNAGGTATATMPGVAQNNFVAFHTEYVTLDDIEMTNAYWPTNPPYGANGFISLGGSSYLDIKNCYFHGWVNPSGADAGFGILGDSHIPSGNVGVVVEDSVFDGTDTAEVMADPNCTGKCFGTLQSMYGGAPIVRNNVFNNVSNGFVGGAQEFSGNLVENIRVSPAGNHENGFENNGDPCSTGLLIFNNVFYHTAAVTLWQQPELTVAGQGTCVPSYGFNNVLYDTDNNNVWDLGNDFHSGPYGTAIVFNNTIEAGRDATPPGQPLVCTAGYTSCVYANNHMITSSSTPYVNCPASNCTLTSNLTQTKAQANSAGYSISQTYVFSPASDSSTTVGAGTSTATLCAAVAAIDADAGTACLHDTAYGVFYDTTTHSVTGPGRTPIPRSPTPSIGAYEDPSSGPVTSDAGLHADASAPDSESNVDAASASDAAGPAGPAFDGGVRGAPARADGCACITGARPPHTGTSGVVLAMISLAACWRRRRRSRLEPIIPSSAQQER